MSNRSFILERELACRRMRACGIILFLVFLTALSGASWGIKSPVGRGTVPASSVGSGRVPGGIYRGGLVRSPNPLDGSGNLTVTGNVRGGRHFRGIVPYQSRYSFEADLPSSSLDSFLRYSAGSEDIGGGAGRYETQPYYSGTRTVTTTRPGYRGVFRPVSTQIDDRASSKSALSPLPKQEASVREYVELPYTRPRAQGLRPLSMSPLELERVILEEIETISESKKLADEQHRPRIEPLPQDLRTVSDKAAELKRGLLVEDELLRLPTRAELGQEEREKFEPRFLLSQESSPDLSGDTQVDVYEQMKWQIQSVARRSGHESRETEHEKLATDEALSMASRRAKRDDEEELFFWVTEAQREARDSSAEEKSPDLSGVNSQKRSSILEESRKSGESKGKGLDSGLKDDLGPSPQDASQWRDVAAKAREILGEHKTFASFAEDKFNRHMRAAEEYLKRGRYYRAADAYTLAAIYKPDDPLAYAGKSHALFAAGEYMSSALFLARALEIFPEYAQFKIDLVAMVGDKDKLESRLANVEEWLDESNAAELQFLLGYVYYQMGRQEEAERMIYAAVERMPESPAVVALKKAITSSLRPPRRTTAE